MAPHTAVQAVKTSILAAAVFEDCWAMRSSPTPDARRTDIIQALEFGTPERLVAFCQAIQAGVAHRQHGGAGALGYARLCRSGHHGGGHLRVRAHRLS